MFQANFHPDSLLRLAQIIGGDYPLIGVGRTRFFELVAEGKLPPPIKVGRATFWRAGDLIDALRQLAQGAGQ